jgi:hypothetical protein
LLGGVADFALLGNDRSRLDSDRPHSVR